MNHSRTKSLLTLILLTFSLLLTRIAYLTTARHHEFTTAAALQRTSLLPLTTSSRGIIYDRNMFPFTLNSPSPQTLLTTSFTIPDSPPTPLNHHHDSANLAPHLIGYVTPDGTLGSGLEKAFNDYLTAAPMGLAFEVSANHQPIAGLGMQMQGRTRKGIQTTLDFRIQSITQETLAQTVSRGAAVVVEVGTGNILAMASTPTFSRQNLAHHLDDNHSTLVNRAITAYDVGSIFKIVTTAAYLETQNSERISYCTGSINIHHRDFFCGNRMGHGEQSLSTAFANSCNIPFYEMGIALGSQRINDYAQRFGLNSPSLDGILPEENAGRLAIGEDAFQIANMSIGQGELQTTPLQIAQLIAVIANNGRYVPARLIEGIIADDGITLTPRPTLAPRQAIQPRTAAAIREMMVETVETGTGQLAQLQNSQSAGKTSSAETGWLYGEETKTHAWFGGFFPAENPRYVIVIFAENGRSGSLAAAPSFAKIANQITNL